jgi:hypothetical protein
MTRADAHEIPRCLRITRETRLHRLMPITVDLSALACFIFMQTLELRYIIASFECRLLLAYQQEQQSCNDIRECHRQKRCIKTEMVDHPALDVSTI